MSEFTLDKAFQKKLTLVDLPLSKIILNDTKIPWAFAIPMRKNISQVNQLNNGDQLQLIKEISFVSNAMEKLFPCDRLNIATIGNKTPQLHIHIICRTKDDPYWPETVWQYDCEKLSYVGYQDRHETIKNYLAELMELNNL